MTGSALSSPQTGSAITLDKALVVDVARITLLWWFGALVVNPVGNFPLNDDWSYSLTAKHFVETGDYRPIGWSSVTLISEVVWGSLFCLPSGFSFTAVRLSVLALSWLGLLGTYVLVRDLKQPRWVALFFTLSLAFNPVYYSLSYTFMTDVPFVAMGIWATVFFARSLKSGAGMQMLIGTFFAVAATLSRQIGICIPVAFAVVLVMRSRLTLRTLLRAAIPVMLCVGAYWGLSYWLESSGRLPKLYYFRLSLLLEALTNIRLLCAHFTENASAVMVYLGLSLLPVFLLSMKDLFWTDQVRMMWASRPKTISILVCVGVMMIALGAHLIAKRPLGSHTFLMPLLGNILIDSGIGPLTLRDTGVLTLNHVPVLSQAFWVGVTVLSLIGAVLFIAKLSVHLTELSLPLSGHHVSDDEAVNLFCILGGMIYLLPVLIYDFVFDRYLLFAMVLFGTGILGLSGKMSDSTAEIPSVFRLSAYGVLLGFGMFAICGTRDYLAWNRVRWEALRYLTQQRHIDPREIDGGFEFNGLYLYDPQYKMPFMEPDFDPETYHPETERSWWWVQRDTYQIGFGEVPDYTVIKEYSYQNWLPPHTQKIVVLKKEGVETPPS